MRYAHLPLVKQTALHAALGLLLIALPAACSDNTSATSDARSASTASDTKSPATTLAAAAPMHFDETNMTIKGQPFTIEIAATEDQRQRGLMFRPTMPADHGMLFIFDQVEPPDHASFWMENTWIPLDIVFLDENARVIETHHRRPMDTTGIGPPRPSLYVIELNVGIADKLGLKPGDTIAIPKKYLKNTSASPEK